MIDSHCHLDQPPLDKNINEVLLRSKSIGIEKLLTISTTTDSFKKILNLVNYDPIIYGTFGIHPHETDKELAKKEVSGISGIDMFAGPSEVTVVADKFSKPEWVSADLIAQSGSLLCIQL